MLAGNNRSLKGSRVRIIANDKYPEVEAIVLRDDFSLLLVRVVGGPYDGAEWQVSGGEVEPITEAIAQESKVCAVPVQPSDPVVGGEVTGQAAVNNMPPHSPNRPNRPEKEPPIEYVPSVSKELVFKGFGKSSVKIAPSGKTVRLPILRADRTKTVEQIQERIDSTTQLVDTGLRVHGDWVAGVGLFLGNDEKPLLSELANILGESVFYEADTPWKMGKVWHSSGRTASGFRIGLNERFEKGGDCVTDVYLSFPGSLMSSRSVRYWWDAFKRIRALIGFRATRFDIALDDYEKSVPPVLIEEAMRKGNVRGLKRDNQKSWRKIENSGNGWTLGLGAPKSANQMRIYDKAIESNGELDCYRWEAELRSDLANQVFSDWLNLDEETFDSVSPMYLGGVVVGRFDFIDRESKPNEKNLKRIPRLDWWQRFVDRVGCEIRHARIRPKRSIDRAMKWINRQVVTTLVILKKAMGTSVFTKWLNDRMNNAEAKRLTAWHHHLVAVYQNEIERVAQAETA